ncbi:MAG: hypothetical protein WC455_18315 [Dehalococcoidia bacterium]|jgi:hypothetical protein
MATYRCEVVTPWNTDTPGFNYQGTELDYPAIWTDVTEQPDENLIPDPNAFVSRGERLSEAQMTALEADTRYVVLWSEEEPAQTLLPLRQGQPASAAEVKPPTGKPNAAEHGKLVSDLARLGISGQLVADLASSKTRRANADLLRAKLKALPKAKDKEKA